MQRLRLIMLAAGLMLAAAARGQAECTTAVKPADEKAFREAIGLYEARSYKEAAQRMRRVAGRNPQAADPQFWLGMMAVKDGFNATAIRRYFTKCLSLCPDYPHGLAHYYMGVILYTDEQYEAAVEALERYFDRANGSDDRALMAVYEEASNYLHWSQFLADAMLHQVPFDPHAVEGVSSKHPEAMPYFTLDGRECFYLRQVPAKHGVAVYGHDFDVKQWKLCSSVWGGTSFSKGEELGAPFNQGGSEGGVTLTTDGCTLYGALARQGGGPQSSDLYRVRREAGQWLQPEPLGPMVNDPRAWDAQPSVSPDGSTLYFASNRAGGRGGLDIWRCRRLPNGDWNRPENLGDLVNTASNEKCPFIAADGHTLYFLSDGWQGFGGFDVYRVDLSEGASARPVNLGLPINSETDEGLFGVTPEGDKAYFVGRASTSVSADVLMFDLYPAARPEPMRWCATTLLVPADSSAEATVTVLREGAESAVCPAKLNRTTAVMLSMQKRNTLVAVAEGMLPTVLTVEAADASRGNPLPEAIELLPSAVGTKVPVPQHPDAQWLDAWADYLVQHPRIHLAIECPRKADAKAIFDHFIAKRLRAERFTYRGGTDIVAPQFIVQ